MDLLWPDAPAPRARHSLAQALTVMKEKVGRDHLVVQRASIALVAGAVQVDVVGSMPVRPRSGVSSSTGSSAGAVQFRAVEGRMARQADARSAIASSSRWTAGVGSATSSRRAARAPIARARPSVRGCGRASSRPGRGWAIGANALKVYGRFEEPSGGRARGEAEPDLCASRICSARAGAQRRPAKAGQVSRAT